eukprot:622558-Lingulodinium_polyedra.AAC.1
MSAARTRAPATLLAAVAARAPLPAMPPATPGGLPRVDAPKVPVVAWRLLLAPCRAKLPRQ